MNVLRPVLVAVGIAIFATAAAHTRSESYSQWHLEDTSVTGIVTIPLREVMLLYQSGSADVPPRDLFRQQLERRTSVVSGSGPCATTATTVLKAASGFVRVEMNFDCGSQPPATLSYRAMFGVAPAHIHYARAYRDGVEVGESLITDAADRWSFAGLETPTSYSFTAFLMIGIEHIAGGIDHIAFLLGLLLIAGSIGRSVIAVTGFTLGHSASLAAAVLGYVSAEGQLVEAFIGFTVALVAVEYFLLRRDRVMPYAVLCLLLALGTGILATAAGSWRSVHCSPMSASAYSRPVTCWPPQGRRAGRSDGRPFCCLSPQPASDLSTDSVSPDFSWRPGCWAPTCSFPCSVSILEWKRDN